MNDINTLAPDSRLWIYQSDRLFTDQEVEEINTALDKFCDQWAAHGTSLKSFGKIYHNCFVVMMVDESQEPASGCSIDSSVGVVRAIMKNYKVDLLNRMIFAYLENDKVELVNRLDFVNMIKEGKITDDTIVFNNLVKDKAEFESKWEVRLVDSWHKQLA